MNSVANNTDEEVQKMLDKFDEVSNRNNTKITQLSTSIQFECDCGCIKVQHFASPFHRLCEKYYIELCEQHEIKLT